jgi:hypothetical protein
MKVTRHAQRISHHLEGRGRAARLSVGRAQRRRHGDPAGRRTLEIVAVSCGYRGGYGAAVTARDSLRAER